MRLLPATAFAVTALLAPLGPLQGIFDGPIPAKVGPTTRTIESVDVDWDKGDELSVASKEAPPEPKPEPEPEPASAPERVAAPMASTDGSAAKEYARASLAARGWGDDQFSCLVSLWQKESGWNHLAANPSSGAYGIPQALPGSKMASAGADWATNPNTQIDWGIGYIADRYGDPCGAWAQGQTGWY